MFGKCTPLPLLACDGQSNKGGIEKAMKLKSDRRITSTDTWLSIRLMMELGMCQQMTYKNERYKPLDGEPKSCHC